MALEEQEPKRPLVEELLLSFFLFIMIYIEIKIENER